MKKRTVVVAILFIAILFVGVLVFYSGDLLALIPGYYQNSPYNEIVVEKNELVDENTILLDENDGLDQEIILLGTSVEDYNAKMEKYEQIQSNLAELSENVGLIVEYDEELLALRLPTGIMRYVELSYELDTTRNDVMSVLQDIVRARVDLNTFRRIRVEFDNCLNNTDRTVEDLVISQSVSTCNEKIVEMQGQVSLMETDHGVELEQLSEYLTLLFEQWDANELYYAALAERNYTAANEHDSVFSERKRQISELELGDVLNEFYAERMEVLISEFNVLSDEEAQKEEDANDWYEKYIE
ncbi:MAG: hypothetical protein U9Q67_04030 [Patescibacteria group bacterium]|nr:hypothetical protein [Patescibacteria group bacterium]